MKDFYTLVWNKLVQERDNINEVWDQVYSVASYLDGLRNKKSIIVNLPDWNEFQEKLFRIMRQVVFEKKQYMQWQVTVAWLQEGDRYNEHRINQFRQEIFDAIDKRASDTHEGKEFLKVSGY